VTDESGLERYDRQMRFAPIGREGQEELRESRVVILGCGALGSGIAQNLARAGIGHLRIVDRDLLEMSNLHRQMLYTEKDVENRSPKAIAAAERLREINSEIEVDPIVTEITPETVLALVADADVVADGTDNMETRFVINDACVKSGVPWVYGGAIAASGMTMTILPGEGPCFRCFIDEIPPAGAVQTCVDSGVINPLTSLVSALESAEVMKILVGAGTPNTQLLRFNVWDGGFHYSHVARRKDCPACGLRRFDYIEGAEWASIRRLGSRQSVQLMLPEEDRRDVADLWESLQGVGKLRYNGHVVCVTTEAGEAVFFDDGRVIVKGTADEQTARDLLTELMAK
jgi:molybdopterin-synthase adenylyltransferase